MPNDDLDRIDTELRNYALAKPEAYEEFPWGERAIKVRKKVFVFFSRHDGNFSVTTKLHAEHGPALLLPFAAPTGYNLGRSGWITARFQPDEPIPAGILMRWIDESYRLVAPKTLLALL